MEVVFRAGGGIEQDALGLVAFGFGGGLQRGQFGAGAGHVYELQDFVVEERGTVQQPAFAEDLAGDHVLEAVAGELLADFFQGFEDVVDLLLDVRVGQEVVLLSVDGFVERAAIGLGEIVGDDHDDVEIRSADHAAGAFFGAGHAVGHLVGDVAGDQERRAAEQARFVGQVGHGHADAFAGQIDFFAGNGRGVRFERGSAGFERGLLVFEADEGVGEEFAADGGGEARIAGDGGVEPQIAAPGAAQDKTGRVAGAPERKDVSEIAGGGEFGAGERAAFGQEFREAGHERQYDARAAGRGAENGGQLRLV